jgi:predicted RNA-binding Zn ribbon-like protein
VEYPILGTEPLPVEFANTLYGDLDCLGTPELASGWFTEMSLGPCDPARARSLRDAVFTLFSAWAAGEELDPGAAEVVNAFAATSPTTLRLTGSGRTWSATWTPVGPEVPLGRIATCAVELLADARELRRCAAPDCGLLFAPHHARRRFCHPSCSGRTRQSRYYRRNLETT